MTSSFGPWTTAIDSGSRAALSTFWKRRMLCLPALGGQLPGVPRLARAALIGCALLACGWPTLSFKSRLAAATAEEESPPAQTPPALTAAPNEPKLGGPLMIPLPGGVHAELIGFADHTAKEKSWWAPDGTPIAAPFARLRAHAVPGEAGIAREVAVQWHLPPGKDITADWDLEHLYGYAGGQGEDAAGKPVKGIEAAAVAMPNTFPTITMTFQVAIDPWTTMAKTDGRHYASQGVGHHGYAFTRAVQEGDSLYITISHDVLDQDIRIIAIGTNGKTITTPDRGGGGAARFYQNTAVFRNLKREDVDHFELQARKFQRVEVRNIALNPGQDTRPTIVPLEEEKAAE
ncbi:MAG: hypothetical protein AB7O59_11000 [Pirellulales bacterium]